MVQAVHFDTLVYANRLKRVGVPSKQAEMEAKIVSEVIEARMVNMATKQDVETSKAELKQDITALRHDMDIKFVEVNSEFSKVYAKFSELEAKMIKWVFGIVFGISMTQAALVVSAIKFLH